MKSPIIHIGGKYWLVKHLLPLLSSLPRQPLLSPFIGGGALEFNIAHHLGWQVLAFDINSDLINFWQHFLKDPDRVCKDAEHLVLSEHRERLNRFNPSYMTVYEQATFFYALNKLSYRGTGDHFIKYEIRDNTIHGHRGAISLDYPNAKEIRECNIRVDMGDFKDTLMKHKDILAYIDPPYTSFDGMLSSKNRPFDHHLLSQILKNERESWILSYSHVPEIPYIRMVYQDYFTISFEKYNNLSSKQGDTRHELLIFSHDLVEPLGLK